jgi:hypothetical protein
VGEWHDARRPALPYESNAHSYQLTATELAQSKINMPSFSDCVGYRADSRKKSESINGRHFIYI